MPVFRREVTSITGTANQVVASASAGPVTLSLPQNIHSAATPTFGGLTLSNLTAGSVPFAGTGGLISQDNLHLFWDGPNSRLGIGTTSPSAKLHIVNSDTALNQPVLLINQQDTANNPFVLQINGTTTHNFSFGSPNHGNFTILSGGATKVLLDSIGDSYFTGGNLGIGTASPGGRLAVTNTAIGEAGKLVNLTGTFTTASSNGTGYGLNITSTVSNTTNPMTAYGLYSTINDNTALANTLYGFRVDVNGTGNAAKVMTGGIVGFSSTSTVADNTIYYYAAGNGHSGNLSSGTRYMYGYYGNPKHNGIVSGTGVINIYGSYNDARAMGASTGGTSNLYGGYFVTYATPGNGGTLNVYGNYIADGLATDGGASNTSTHYGLYIEAITGSDSNYALVTAGAGNVGIGLTTPSAKLQVNGNLALVDGMTAPGTIAGYATIYVDSADGDLKVKFGDGTVKTLATDT